jgi:molybdenum cofactor guanylyltransferase
MGQDKGLIVYHGQPQREYLTALLTKFCKHVFLSCKPAADIPATLHPLYDQFDLDSPLNGILSAFQHDPTVAWLTVPVDMPLVNDMVLQYLITHRDPQKLATCFYDSEGKKPEPLLTIWEPAAALPLQEFYAGGNVSPRKFLIENVINILTPPAPEISQNINTPEELARFLSGDHSS